METASPPFSMSFPPSSKLFPKMSPDTPVRFLGKFSPHSFGVPVTLEEDLFCFFVREMGELPKVGKGVTQRRIRLRIRR